MKTLARWLIAVFVVFAGNCVHAKKLDTELLHSLANVKYHELESSQLERSFHIFVDLPDEYTSSHEAFPTIYLLDGDITFPLLVAYHRYLRLGGEAPAAILVGISYGAESVEKGNMRSTDFTAPSTERDYWGGAPIFQNVLKKELLPLIEKTYRSDSSRRIIFGQSLGGQFVLYTALTQAHMFYGHIASNPALHRNLPFFLSWQGPDAMPDTDSRLFVSSGEYDVPRYREPALEWIEHWQKASKKPWHLETRTLVGQSHFSAAPSAYRQGLDWLFSIPDQE